MCRWRGSTRRPRSPRWTRRAGVSRVEAAMLRIAASLAAGGAVDLGRAPTCLDEVNLVLVGEAVAHGGGRDLGGCRSCSACGCSGERSTPGLGSAAAALSSPARTVDGVVRTGHPGAASAGRAPAAVLGRMRRHGRVELLVVLPDGARRCCPRAGPTRRCRAVHRRRRAAAATLGSLHDCSTPQRCWPSLLPDQRGQRAGCTAVTVRGGQPCNRQLSLMPDQLRRHRPPAQPVPRSPARGRGRRAGPPDRPSGDGRTRSRGGR